MKVKELETTDLKSVLLTMEEQIKNASNETIKDFLQDYYKDFIEEAKNELLKRG